MGLLLVATAFGGASRPDVAAPIVVRFCAMLVITALLMRGCLHPARWGRGEKFVWGLLLSVPLLQLIPLPPSLWTALPTHVYAARLFEITGIVSWQPLTLVHDRTVNAFAALIPALAAFSIGRILDDRAVRQFWLALLLIALFSALLGIAQMLGGPGSALRLYAITNDDSAVGLFSNANHHALFLAIALPAVALWLDGYREPNQRIPRSIQFGAGLAFLVLVAASLLTLSRAGIAFMFVSSIVALWLFRYRKLDRILTARRVMWMGATVALIAVAALMFRASLSAYLGVGEPEGRLENLPLLLSMIRDGFPFGTGMGSLDPVFRGYETVDRLQFGYLNNAHDDYLQLVIEAGAFAVIGLIAFFVVIVPPIFVAWREQARSVAVRPLSLCALAVTLTLIHSLVDYPLRTAAVSVVFALCCGALLSYSAARVAGRGKENPFGGSVNA